MAFIPEVLLSEVSQRERLMNFDDLLIEPVLDQTGFTSPVMISDIQLLRNGEIYLVRARSTDGAEGIAISNSERMGYLYPILTQRVAPCFIGKDARNIESLIWEAYVHDSNYKLQGLPFWVCVASVEFALLDLLGHISNKSVGELFGPILRREIDVYLANNDRDRTAEETVARIAKGVEKYGVRAVKFKVGGRMSGNEDSIHGRTEKLIPLARKTFGDAMRLYADANGSYDVPRAIEIGKLLETHQVGYFEEPCPFDDLEGTKAIADALEIPIAGGEQESSLFRFLWLIRHGALQIVQPDLFYYGGFIRSVRVARLAAEFNLKIVPHMAGETLNDLYVLHFASFIPNAGEFMEYKGRKDSAPYTCETSNLICRNGQVRVPDGPGFGICFDPDFITASAIVKG